jgi:hypothetical protein
MKKLMLVSLVVLAACAPKIEPIKIETSVTERPSGTPALIQSYNLNAYFTANDQRVIKINGTAIIAADGDFRFPLTITTTYDGSGDRQAILHLGNYNCLYIARASEATYERQDGSCTVSPAYPVTLHTGDELMLEIVWTSNTSYTAALAVVSE